MLPELFSGGQTWNLPSTERNVLISVVWGSLAPSLSFLLSTDDAVRMYSSRILEKEPIFMYSVVRFLGVLRTEEQLRLRDARVCIPLTTFWIEIAAVPNLRDLRASMQSKASRRRNTLVRPSCSPARAHRDEKSKARNSCDDCGRMDPEWNASAWHTSFSLKESFRSDFDKNADRDERKLDLLAIELGRVCTCGIYWREIHRTRLLLKQMCESSSNQMWNHNSPQPVHYFLAVP